MVHVGENALRKEGPEKLCGLARYVDDHPLPDCLHAVTLRSTIAHGTIEEIDYDPEFPWHEFAVATADDIPGLNGVTLIEADQPLLASRRILHAMEPILVIGHPERSRAYEALQHVRVRYSELPAVLDMDASLAAEQLLRGDDNVFKRFVIERGSLRKGMAAADVVVEGVYEVPHQEQAYIENNGMAAWVEPDGTLVLLGSIQCPYYVQKAMAPIFGLPPEKIRVIQAVTGGGFGGKEEYPNMLAGHAALLAVKTRRPVKMIYDRHEDMLATTKRHPARIHHRTGLTRDGKLVAQDIDVVMDGGAYVTLSPVVLSRGVLHATGPYECPHVRAVARSVATNTPPNGAFRGFGAPQTLFAAELHWEKIAAELGIDSLELRRRNLIREGSTLATGQVLKESVGASEVLERAVSRSGYVKQRKAHQRWNRKKSNPTWRGIGVAVVLHGAGFTGSGETYLASRAGVCLNRDGSVCVDAASTEIGQGTRSMFAQIVADTLGLPYEEIEVEDPDTAKVPDSGPTVASRTCMVVGSLLQRAAGDLRAAVEEVLGYFPTTRQGLREAALRLCDGKPSVAFIAQYQQPENVQWDDQRYRGDAYPVYSYGSAVIDLEVDKVTYEVKVARVTTAQDIGKAINPLLVEGQIIGGTAQALGYALMENTVYENGILQNPQLTNYIIPTAMDTPPMDVEIVEMPYSRGPFGAKGVGELPMDVPGPAVAAAIHQATGLWIPRLPILPETLAQGFRDAAEHQ